MEKKMMMSIRYVIVFRGIWYVMILLSLFGLYTSIDQLWSRSRFLRYIAVGATTFYAVTLFRYLFFTDRRSSSYYKDKEFITCIERIPQATFSYSALLALIFSPLMYTMLIKEFVLSVSLLTISLFTGGIGFIQLSDKFRMEMRHALLTLFLGCLFCLSTIFMCRSYVQDRQGSAWFLCLNCQWTLNLAFAWANLHGHKVYSKLHYPKVDSDTLNMPLLGSSHKL